MVSSRPSDVRRPLAGLAAVLGLPLAATLLTSCAGASTGGATADGQDTTAAGTTSSAPATRPPSTSPPAPVTTPAPQPLQAARQWEWSSLDGDGYTATHVLAVGTPVPAGQAPVLAGFTAASASTTCPASPTTDAVLPFQLTSTNTSPGFAYSTNVQVKSMKPAVPVAVAYSTGLVCENANGYAGWSLECPSLAPSASCEEFGYIVLEDYFSPAHPQGDETSLSDYRMLVGSETSSGGPMQMTSMTGPGGTVFADHQGEFRLSGT